MSRGKGRWVQLIALVSVVLLIDQITKRLVVNTIMLYESVQPVPWLYPFFQITRSENRGAAFGFLPQAGDIFLILSVIIVGALVVFYPRLPDNAWLSRVGFALVCGGALGNALDRLEYGAVVDFIHYTIPGIISNVSNLADHAIVGGVLLLVIESWRTEPKSPPAENTPSTADDA